MSVSLIDGHIDEPKITDNEIIKALECCVSYEYTCLNCPYCEDKHYTEENGFELMPNGKYYDDLSCDEWLKRDVFDLVNRQKAEIERLKTEKHFAIQNLTEEIKRLQKGIVKNLDEFASEYDEKIKAAAVKDLLIRLTMHFATYRAEDEIKIKDMFQIIQKFAEETVGESQ